MAYKKKDARPRALAVEMQMEFAQALADQLGQNDPDHYGEQPIMVVAELLEAMAQLGLCLAESPGNIASDAYRRWVTRPEMGEQMARVMEELGLPDNADGRALMRIFAELGESITRSGSEPAEGSE